MSHPVLQKEQIYYQTDEMRVAQSNSGNDSLPEVAIHLKIFHNFPCRPPHLPFRPFLVNAIAFGEEE